MSGVMYVTFGDMYICNELQYKMHFSLRITNMKAWKSWFRFIFSISSPFKGKY